MLNSNYMLWLNVVVQTRHPHHRVALKVLGRLHLLHQPAVASAVHTQPALGLGVVVGMVGVIAAPQTAAQMTVRRRLD